MHTHTHTHTHALQAVYKATLKKELTYIGGMCEALREAFAAKYGKDLKTKPFQSFEFTAEFERTRKATEETVRTCARAVARCYFLDAA
jgi:hypothetical protein